MTKLHGKLWIYLPAASEESGVPISTLRRWCDQGRVRCRKVGNGRGRWQVLRSSLRNAGRG